MKKLLLIIAVAILTQFVYGKTIEEKVEWLIEESIKSQCKCELEKTNSMIIAPLKAELPDELAKELEKEMKALTQKSNDERYPIFKKHKKDFVAIYRKLFSDSEINEIFRFYSSGVGLKYYKNAEVIDSKITEALTPLLQTFLTTIMTEKPNSCASKLKAPNVSVKKLSHSEESALWYAEQITPGFFNAIFNEMICSNAQRKESLNMAKKTFFEELPSHIRKNVSYIQQAFLEYLTEKEFECVIQFYKSSIGKKMIANTEELLEKFMKVTQPEDAERMATFQKNFAKKVADFFAKEIEKLEKNPKPVPA